MYLNKEGSIMAFFSLGKKKLKIKSLHSHIISLIFYTFNIFICLYTGLLKKSQLVTSTRTKEGLLIYANFSATIFKSALKPVPARNSKNNEGCFLSKETEDKKGRKKERETSNDTPLHFRKCLLNTLKYSLW